MKTKLTLAVATVLVALTVFIMTARIFRSGRNEYSVSTPPPLYLPPKTYKVLPSDTDGQANDCPPPVLAIGSECQGAGTAIGCDFCWPVLDANGILQYDNDGFLISSAPNHKHVLYVPVGTENTGKVLVFLAGYPGNPDHDALHDDYHWLYMVMAWQGYHVIGLSTFTGLSSDCQQKDSACLRMKEGITGVECTTESDVSEHRQDSLVNRLVKVLEWAAANHSGDGWGRYLTGPQDSHSVDWTQVHLAGFSGGSSYASFMGTLYPEVRRVTLFSGPNDGEGASEDEWTTAGYIQPSAGSDTRYYGLVHKLNKAEAEDNPILYKVIEAWRKFGMEDTSQRVEFDPKPGETPDFTGSHMLISTDKGTTFKKAHTSVVLDEYKDCDDLPESECKAENRIGYEAAWRYILGTGTGD